MSARAFHTPGPWEAGINPKGMFSNEVVVRPAGQFPHGEWIADCGPNFLEDAETHAHARLIAAAPDLLALAKLVHGSFGGGLVMTFTEADVAAFEAAIAKAEGRP